MSCRLRHIIFFLLIAVLTIPVSCRKGEEDPFLSLRSRNNRIEGKWILSTLEQNIINKSSSPYDIEVLFDYNYYGGGRIAKKYDISGYYSLLTSFDVKLDILENGNTAIEYFIESKDLDFKLRKTSSGTWSWKNDIGKRKEYVNFSDLTLLMPDLINYFSENYSMFLTCDFDFSCLNGITDYQIIRLSHDELKLLFEKDVTSGNTPYSVKTEMFFKKQKE